MIFIIIFRAHPARPEPSCQSLYPNLSAYATPWADSSRLKWFAHFAERVPEMHGSLMQMERESIGIMGFRSVGIVKTNVFRALFPERRNTMYTNGFRVLGIAI